MSLASLPSLSDPPTPPVNSAPIHPRLTHQLKPNPLPSSPPDEMHIHFLLAFIPFNTPPIEYNVATPPTLLLGGQVSLAEFHEPATQPHLHTLTVYCPNLLMPITIIAGEVGYVTISDVLHAIHHELRLPTNTTEYKNLPVDVKPKVDATYFQRCRRSGDEARQLEMGIKRVDFLLGKTHFFGLSGTLHGPDIWELNVG
ncbi:hypothetical protein H0H81_007314 [Sphagnurus paluster]|uniref:DUF6699 domain-containing protein n=1 Tax=Sphagnurus paluster TaxID=117069 RepID=A0A9P7K5I2_9AGAR|nr:hypothetical protein H0H81_007314 [Sphagnurus paluster]